MLKKNKPDNWYEAMNNISSLLYKKQVKFFMDSGTLLGFVRNNDFISWDNDIDLGVLEESISLNVLERLLKEEYGAVLVTKYAFYIKIKGVDVGLNIYKKNKKNYITGYWSIKTKSKIKLLVISLLLTKIEVIKKRAYYGVIGDLKNKIISYITLIFPLKFANWIIGNFIIMKESIVEAKVIGTPIQYKENNINSFVPENSEDYLQLKYGKDWRIPKKEYHYIRDDGTLVNEG